MESTDGTHMRIGGPGLLDADNKRKPHFPPQHMRHLCVPVVSQAWHLHPFSHTMLCGPGSCDLPSGRCTRRPGVKCNWPTARNSDDSTSYKFDDRRTIASTPTHPRHLEMARQLLDELTLFEPRGHRMDSYNPSPSSAKERIPVPHIRISEDLEFSLRSPHAQQLPRNRHCCLLKPGRSCCRDDSRRESANGKMRFRRQRQQRSDSTASTKHQKQPLRPIWRKAVDPNSGKTYFYDAITRKTQWEKPADLESEIRKRAHKEKLIRYQFFRDMEHNIYRSLAKGEPIPGLCPTKEEERDLPPRGSPPHMLATPPSPMSPSAANTTTRSVPKIHLGTAPPGEKNDQTTNTGSQSFTLLNSCASSSNMSSTCLVPDRNATGCNAKFNETAGIQTISIRDEILLGELNLAAEQRMLGHTAQNFARQQKDFPRKHLYTRGRIAHHSEPPDLSCESKPWNKRAYRVPDQLVAEGSVLGRSENGLHKSCRGETVQQKERLHRKKHMGTSAPSHVRRNTEGTAHVFTTMSSPDVNATIRCVCGVYRAHILLGTNNAPPSPASVRHLADECGDTFRDGIQASNTSCPQMPRRFSEGSPHVPFMTPPHADPKTIDTEKTLDSDLPSLDEICAFYRDFYEKSQMEHSIIIMSLIYVERLIKETKGCIRPCAQNWKSVIFSSMVLASKVWDDMSMWNIDFSRVALEAGCSTTDSSPLSSFTLHRINQLEVAFWRSLNFNVKVTASEYARYYFFIRSMLIRSGLLDEGPNGNCFDMEAAKNIEALSAEYKCEVAVSKRSKSLDNYGWLPVDVFST